MTYNVAKPKSKVSLPCLLCIHGGGTSASIFKIQTTRLQRALSGHFRFVFVDGPFECEAGPGVLPFFDGMGPYRRWINEEGFDEDKVRPLLRKRMAEDGGQFVGVLGFSQGARLALGLLHEKQEMEPEAFYELRFGVFICGTYPPLGLSSSLFEVAPIAQFESHSWDEKHENILSIPSIHVIGDNDPYRHKSRLLAQCSEPSSASIMRFRMGHHLPVLPADTQRLADGILNLYRTSQRDIDVQTTKEIEKALEQIQVAEV